MKKLVIITLSVLVLTGVLACNLKKPPITPAIAQLSDEDNPDNTNKKNKKVKLKITVENKEFTATLNDSESAREIVQLLPMTVIMNEHNGNEKYYKLPKSISGKALNPGRVQAGDLMIWSSSTLVLFYSGGSAYYSYISLGHIDDVSGLNQAVGRGSVKVTFEIHQQETEIK